jgi:diguanylate cyclase (GGDEF)-like protein
MKLIERSPRFWLLQLGLAVLWILVWQWGRLLSQTVHASLWFPPAGLSFAMFLTQGPLASIPIIVAGTVTMFHTDAIEGTPADPLMLIRSGLAFGVVHSLAYGVGARLFGRLHGEAKLGTPRAVFGFLFFSTLAAILAALGGILSLQLTGVEEVSLRADMLPWSIGDLVAVVTLAPLFVLFCDWAAVRIGLPSSGWLEGLGRMGSPASTLPIFGLKVVASVLLALGLAALGTIPGVAIPVALIVYALIVPLTWITHTEGAVRAIFAVASLASAVALAAALFGTAEQAFSLQAAMIAIAGTSAFNLTIPRLYADNRRLHDLVTFDQLTGAFTRPVFLERADRELMRARRDGTPMALAVLDLDHFKSINDSHGHGTGDRVLAGVGQICRGVLREGEIIGRIGGEEFAILLSNTDLETAQRITERLRSAIEQAEWPFIRGGLTVTASLGVTDVDPEQETLEEALERADRAMYEAKRSGRNCVAVSNGQGPVATGSRLTDRAG